MEISDLRLVFSELDGKAVLHDFPRIVESIAAIHCNALVSWDETCKSLDIRINNLNKDVESADGLETQIAAIAAPYAKPITNPSRVSDDADANVNGIQLYGLRYADIMADYERLVSELNHISHKMRLYIEYEKDGVCCVHVHCGSAKVTRAVEAFADAILKEYAVRAP